tara:strand:- start:231 stop:839 length:609 start_codon:yes stop_codon:yes gene_type:complete
MANVNDINISPTTQYYDAQQDTTSQPLIAKQIYPCHIKEVFIREVDVKKKYRAKVYNITLEIADSIKNESFDTEKGTVLGGSFVGRKLYSTGVFFFLAPNNGDTFQANPGGNERYLKLCEAIGIDCPVVSMDVEVDGKVEKREVKSLPILTDNDMIGKSIRGYLDYAPYTDKDGNKKTSLKVKLFEPCDLPDRDFAVDELPF